MVSLVVGFPGSGKSYYAIDKIYNILSGNDKTFEGTEVIYTNINGVKYDFFPDSNVQFKKLIIDDLYNYLTECYQLKEKHQNDDDVDEHLIKLSKEKGFFNCLIVFDECHDFFTPQDKIKVFWLTYHRHLHHEIILLTQNKSLIHSKYRAIPEQFIEAQPRSKKLFDKTLNYKSYASFAMRKADMFSKFSVKTRKEVFELYKSGNTSKQKSIIYKFLIIFALGLIVAGFLFYNLLSAFSTEDTINYPIESNTPISESMEKNSKINQVQSEKISSKKSFNYGPENKVYSFLCDQKNGCIIFDNTYSLHYVNRFIRETESKKLNMEFIYFNSKTKQKVYKYYILTNIDLLSQFFVIKKEDEKKPKKDNSVDFNSITEKVSL